MKKYYLGLRGTIWQQVAPTVFHKGSAAEISYAIADELDAGGELLRIAVDGVCLFIRQDDLVFAAVYDEGRPPVHFGLR
jgi:hypothetical protein